MFYDVPNVVNGVKMHLVVTYYMKRVYEHYVCNIRDKTSGHVGTRLQCYGEYVKCYEH